MQLKEEKGVLALEDESGNLVSAIWYAPLADRWTVAHTFTEPAHRGKGYAAQLMEKLAQKARAQKAVLVPHCNYATYWLDRHPEYEDVRDKAAL